MKILIVEDDFASRKLLQGILSPYGVCDIAVNGEEAINAFKLGINKKEPYDLICMDIMLPNIDGNEAIVKIREIERNLEIKSAEEVKVIMITALGDPKTVFKSFYKGGATSYLVKPIRKQGLLEELKKLELIK